jgi:hypothetical protein
MRETVSTGASNAPLQRFAMFTSGLTLGVAAAVLVWAVIVARS